MQVTGGRSRHWEAAVGGAERATSYQDIIELVLEVMGTRMGRIWAW